MLNLGMSEILLFAIVSLIVLGPEKLPEAARFAGRWYGKLKRLISNVHGDIDRELRISELREQMQQELERIKELEEKMQAQMVQIEKQDLLADTLIAKETHRANDGCQKHFTLCQHSHFKTPFTIQKQPVLSSTLNLKKAV